MKRIALIDDDSDNRLLVRAMLEDRYEIDEYATGTEALNGIRRRRPDIVLLDIQMPGYSGVSVVRWLREDALLCDIPVIAVTAHAMAGDRERLILAGFNDYVSKPIVDEDALVRMIERWIAPGALNRTPGLGTGD
ncbi:MAG TPA: response regulator [Gemmatimonadaceae bacterium]|nr:response regulator [Gemmatimonadaceae bacterium]